MDVTIAEGADIAGPVTATERIVAIDVLRGVAILGILVMNIQSFSMIVAAYMNPHAYGDLSGGNYLVWLLSHVVADKKFMTIFSVLFGAGVVLMDSRRRAAGKATAGVHYRRMFWLVVLGLLHGRLLWHGDILYAYGLCGLAVFLLRNRSPRFLIIAGLLVFSVPSMLTMFWQVTIPYWPEGTLEKVEQEWWMPAPEQVQTELDAYRGSWTEQQSVRAHRVTYMETDHFLSETMWRAGGLMLAGMALFKLGVLSAQRSRGFYRRMVGLGLGLGVPIVVLGVVYRESTDWSIRWAFFGGSQFNYWGSVLVAAGILGGVMLACRQTGLDRFTRPLAAVGRMALSCYLFQTLICTTLFYGHGLGLFGSVERTVQALLVAAVWVALLLVCPIWLRHFRFGPFEWLWRSLTYMRPQPMLRPPLDTQ